MEAQSEIRALKLTERAKEKALDEVKFGEFGVWSFVVLKLIFAPPHEKHRLQRN